MLQVFLAIVAFIWFIAVIKVFVLEEKKVVYKELAESKRSAPTPIANKVKKLTSKSSKRSFSSATSTVSTRNVPVVIPKTQYRTIEKDINNLQLPPLSTDWLSIHAAGQADQLSTLRQGKQGQQPQIQQQIQQQKQEQSLPHPPSADNLLKELDNVKTNNIQIDRNSGNNNNKVVQIFSKPASDLAWPPVLPDFSIPKEDGSEKMPIIGIEVPRFWFPPEGVDYNSVGYKINGQDTIFLMIASYRDFQCRETITSAFMRADYPERLFVGAVDQVVPGDIGCLDLEVPCDQDPTQMICKYRDQISIYKMDAQYATGPVTARHIGDRMYRGQTFVMQMDAHCLFVRHWDSQIIQQWQQTHNEMAVLSSYLTDVQGSLTPEGDSTRHTRPIMCNSDFEGAMPARYLRHGSQPEDMAEIRDMPQMQPFWAAGFSFSKGHFKLRVPYDAYQPMVFQGEEIAIGIRGFTHGYDFYAPRDSVVFHEYADNSARRKKIHMFWENTGHAGEGQKSLRRATSVIGMAPDIDPASWDHSELDRYGLGKVRPLSLFYKLFLIDTKARKATQLCPFVKTGIMHRDFQPLLRPDGLGIDYSTLVDYDTGAKIQAQLERQHPYWEQRLRESMAKKDLSGLRDALSNAKRVNLDKKNPDIVGRAEAFLTAGSR